MSINITIEVNHICFHPNAYSNPNTNTPSQQCNSGCVSLPSFSIPLSFHQPSAYKISIHLTR